MLLSLSIGCTGGDELGFCSEYPAPRYQDGDEEVPGHPTGDERAEASIGTRLTLAGFPSQLPDEIVLSDAAFGSMLGPFACDGSWIVQLRSQLEVDGQPGLGRVWIKLDANGAVLPGDLDADLGSAATERALDAGVIEHGRLGLRVREGEATLLQFEDFDPDTLLFVAEQPIPGLPAGTAVWAGG